MSLFGPPNVEKLEIRRNVKGLIRALFYKKSRNVRVAAAEALVRIGDAHVVESLIGVLAHEDSTVRAGAAGVLRKCNAPEAMMALAQFEESVVPVTDSALSQAIQDIEEAESNLYHSFDPDYAKELADRLLRSPQAALQAIRKRGWHKRGDENEPANVFLVYVMGRVYSETKGQSKNAAVSALVDVFRTPDDNTTGWVHILEKALAVISEHDIQEARSELKALKKQVAGTNAEYIEVALERLDIQREG